MMSKGIEVLPQLVGDDVQPQSLGGELFDDGLLPLGRVPALEEIVQAPEAPPQRLSREVPQRLRDEPAGLIHVRDPLGEDGRAHTIDVHLELAARRRRNPAGGP